jgi:hypothetical protein
MTRIRSRLCRPGRHETHLGHKALQMYILQMHILQMHILGMHIGGVGPAPQNLDHQERRADHDRAIR